MMKEWRLIVILVAMVMVLLWLQWHIAGKPKAIITPHGAFQAMDILVLNGKPCYMVGAESDNGILVKCNARDLEDVISVRETPERHLTFVRRGTPRYNKYFRKFLGF